MAGLSSGEPSLEDAGCETTTVVLVHSPRATLAAATTHFANRARSPAAASKRGETRAAACPHACNATFCTASTTGCSLEQTLNN